MLWFRYSFFAKNSWSSFAKRFIIGKYVLEPYESTPALITELLTGTDGLAKEFKANVRAYNSALSFTSLGVNLDRSVQNSHGGAYASRIHGSLYHRIGSILPENGNSPAFAQIYVFDTTNELRNRYATNSHIMEATLSKLQCLMRDINPFVSDFTTMAEMVATSPEGAPVIRMVFQAEGTPDPRRYNRPVGSTEVGILIIGSG